MATRPAIECPICHVDVNPGRKLREHLLEDHPKQDLVRFVISEREAQYRDIAD